MVMKVIFTSIMIGFGGADNNGHVAPAPTVFKETVVLEGDNAMRVCRQMESDFHGGYTTKRGSGTYSTEEFETGKGELRATVQRESRCSKVN